MNIISIFVSLFIIFNLGLGISPKDPETSSGRH